MSGLRKVAFALGAAFGRGGKKQKNREPIVEQGEGSPGGELVVVALLLLSALFAVGFIVVYATGHWPMRTQFEGIALGGSLVILAIALIVWSRKLVVTEELEEEYPLPHPEQQEQVTQIVRESGSRFTRKRLLGGALGASLTALGLAAISPIVSLGPMFDSYELNDTPWKRGKRLVTEDGTPLAAADIEENTFYTAYPEHSTRKDIAAPLVLVKLPTNQLHLPRRRRNWAPQGILAYSKICTHAGCAISLYRKPTFPPTQPRPALVCPCHYSTFDPADGGTVIFGPAGRNLPQLPLMVDSAGHLRAAGLMSGPVGPSWWGVRLTRANYSER